MIYYIGKDKNYSGDINYSTIDECIEYLKNKTEIGIDIETSRKFPKSIYREDVYKPGLDPYVTKICMLQIGTIDTQYIIDVRSENVSKLKELFDDSSKLFIGSNLKFEAKHLSHNYNIIFYNIWDCMLVDQVLTNGMELGYSVEKMAERYLGIKSSKDANLFNQFEEDEEFVDKGIRMQFIDIGDKPFTEKQIKYGADDIIIPLKIRKEQLKNVYFPEECINLENSFCTVLADIELKGIEFSKEQWLQVAKLKQIEYDLRLKKINSYVETHHKEFCKIPDLFDSTRGCNIMWSSSDQVIKYFRFLKFCPQEKSKQTKKLEYTVGAKALFKLLSIPYKEYYMSDEETNINSNEDLILNYLLLKKSEQAITTFGEEFLKYIHPITKRIHSNYKQILNTGRISSSGPNLQNIPANIEYRKSFIAKTNSILVNADYASQESRVLAEVCGDEDMLKFFNEGHSIFGDDYHSFIATKMFRIIRNQPELIITKKTHPKERQDAKAINFKISYGGSAFTLKDDFGVSEDVAQEFIDGFFEAIPTLKADFEKTKEDVIKLGYIEIDGITKRRWFWKEWEYYKQLEEEIWGYYPFGYRHMSDEKKKEAKNKIYKEFPELKLKWSEFFSLKGKAERNALNYRIQGAAANQTKRMGILFRKYQIENNLQNIFYLVNLIHDESLAETTIDFKEKAKPLLEKFMEEGAQYYCKKVIMKAESVLTEFWHH